MAGPVTRWLDTFMCGHYAEAFDAYGYETLLSVCQLERHQLHAMTVRPDDAEKIMENIYMLRQSIMASNHQRYSVMPGNPPNVASTAHVDVARNNYSGNPSMDVSYGHDYQLQGYEQAQYYDPASYWHDAGHSGHMMYSQGYPSYSHLMDGSQSTAAPEMISQPDSDSRGHDSSHLTPLLMAHPSPGTMSPTHAGAHTRLLSGSQHGATSPSMYRVGPISPSLPSNPPTAVLPLPNRVPASVSCKAAMADECATSQCHGVVLPSMSCQLSPSSTCSASLQPSRHKPMPALMSVSSPVSTTNSPTKLSLQQSPQEVADNILQMATHQYSGVTSGNSRSPTMLSQHQQRPASVPPNAMAPQTSAMPPFRLSVSPTQPGLVPGSADGVAKAESNPLQSLRELVMLSESQVVDPKSVVNEASLMGENGGETKNGDGCGLSGEAVDPQPASKRHCLEEADGRSESVCQALPDDDLSGEMQHQDMSDAQSSLPQPSCKVPFPKESALGKSEEGVMSDNEMEKENILQFGNGFSSKESDLIPSPPASQFAKDKILRISINSKLAKTHHFLRKRKRGARRAKSFGKSESRRGLFCKNLSATKPCKFVLTPRVKQRVVCINIAGEESVALGLNKQACVRSVPAHLLSGDVACLEETSGDCVLSSTPDFSDAMVEPVNPEKNMVTRAEKQAAGSEGICGESELKREVGSERICGESELKREVGSERICGESELKREVESERICGESELKQEVESERICGESELKQDKEFAPVDVQVHANETLSRLEIMEKNDLKDYAHGMTGREMRSSLKTSGKPLEEGPLDSPSVLGEIRQKNSAEANDGESGKAKTGNVSHRVSSRRRKQTLEPKLAGQEKTNGSKAESNSTSNGFTGNNQAEELFADCITIDDEDEDDEAEEAKGREDAKSLAKQEMVSALRKGRGRKVTLPETADCGTVTRPRVDAQAKKKSKQAESAGKKSAKRKTKGAHIASKSKNKLAKTPFLNDSDEEAVSKLNFRSLKHLKGSKEGRLASKAPAAPSVQFNGVTEIVNNPKENKSRPPMSTLMERCRADSVWVCCFCGKESQHRKLGPLLGPHFPCGGRDKWPDLPDEIWFHDDCIVWSPGVYFVPNQLGGLEETVSWSRSSRCSTCNRIGATLGCVHRGCKLRYHYLCAVQNGCQLNEENFTVICQLHKDKDASS